jgi:hypothetical protein
MRLRRAGRIEPRFAGSSGCVNPGKIDEVALKPASRYARSGMTDIDGDFYRSRYKGICSKPPRCPFVRFKLFVGRCVSRPKIFFMLSTGVSICLLKLECFHESDTYPHTVFLYVGSKIRA